MIANQFRGRSVRAPMLLAVLCWVLTSGFRPCSAQPAQPPSSREKVSDFFDKWIVNGGNVGGAIGAVVGQAAFAAVLPRATSMVLGSFVGNQIGQLIGEYADNKVNKSYNYVAFNRPSLGEPGSVWLKNAGPYEQSFYQIDRWAISGGTMASLATHFAINAAARAIPGAAILANPIVNVLANYVAGTIGDNLDGMIDLAAFGRSIDQKKGLTPRTGPAPRIFHTGPEPPPTAVPSGAPAGPVSTASDRADRQKAYLELKQSLTAGDAKSARDALERYRKGPAGDPTR